MSEKVLIITNTFQCEECGLIYYDGDAITTRYVGEQVVHDCDNCLAAIELNIEGSIVTKK